MTRLSRLTSLAFGLVLACVGLAAQAANPIQTENAKPGTWDWYLWNPISETAPEIEGYASATSVNRGGQISFFVNTPEPTYSVSVYRLGWYAGTGARQVLGPVTRAGRQQVMPTSDPTTGLVECNWVDPYTITIPNTADPTDWASGFYVAKLTGGTSGKESWILFVVRDDARSSDHLFQASVTTWQAYNTWGGKSLYGYASTNNAPARKVSFNRPTATTGGMFLTWEVKMLRFMEREGYDVSYITNLDLHERGNVLLAHRSFLSVGHDEYWSYAMRSAAQNASAQGVNLGFFSANSVYWQVRFEPSSTAVPNRTMVAYKEAAAALDPVWNDADPSNDKTVTTRFRDLAAPPFNIVDPVARPENALIGVMYHHDPVNADIVVTNASHWIYANTGITNGFRFVSLLGYETDTIFDNGFSPPGLVKLSESPDGAGFSHMTLYTAPSGAMVFATGSMQWTWGLDNGIWGGGCNSTCVTAEAQQTTRNILARFASAGPALTAPASVNATAGDRRVDLAWGAVTGATSYNIYRATSPGGQGSAPYRTGLSATLFSESGLTNGQTYYYQVAAVNGGGVGPRSAEVGATPIPPPLPMAPTNVLATASDGVVNLSWGAVSGATSYRIFRATTSGGQGSSAYRSNLKTTSFADTSLVNGTTYYYQVAALATSGLGPRSAEVSVTATVNVPAPPTALWSSATTTGQVRLRWTQSTSPYIVRNHVYRATSAGGPFVQIATLNKTTAYTDSPGAGAFYYAVTSVNAGGLQSAYSNIVLRK